MNTQDYGAKVHTSSYPKNSDGNPVIKAANVHYYSTRGNVAALRENANLLNQISGGRRSKFSS